MGDIRGNGEAILGPSCNPNHQAACWEAAEQVTQDIISHVRPTIASDFRRKEVIAFVQNLIRSSLGCEVFPFGSVPLQTYLPDGDIDLTSFGILNVEDALAEDVLAVLQDVERSMNSKFEVKDVQLIRAEVKIVKCLVQNIVVDISFNQFGGLSTLCFLQQVDQLIGKDHLFKRSIILIKAWCYYESRILGAHHGLISTYALETLVLYIFHVFHSSLNGPLAVLYKFLDYFSKFDWDNYCVSLRGPISISLFPEVTVEAPENSADLLLSDDFIRDCVNSFAVSPWTPEVISRGFQIKHLNIVDPLKNTNNLGRSVSKGNFYRIRSAFTYGARKLGFVLSGKTEGLLGEVQNFFASTLDRHGERRRPDVPVPFHGFTRFWTTLGYSGVDTGEVEWATSASESAEVSLISCKDRIGKSNSSGNGVFGAEISGKVNDLSKISMMRVPIPNESPEDSVASRLEGLLVTHEEIFTPSGKVLVAPHLDFPCIRNENKGIMNEDHIPRFRNSANTMHILDTDSNNDVYTNHVESQICEDGVQTPHGFQEDPTVSCIASSKMDAFHFSYKEPMSNNNNKASVAMDSLADLGGDYDSNLLNLQRGRWCYERASCASVQAIHPVMSSQMAFRSNIIIPPVSPGANGVHQSPFYHVNQQMMNGAGCHMEEKPRMRGIGTYFPNMNHYVDNRHAPRARNYVSAKSPSNNGHHVIFPDMNFLERAGHEFSLSHSFMPPGEKMYISENLLRESLSWANGSATHHEGGIVDLGSFEQLPLELQAKEGSPQKQPPNSPFAASSDPLSAAQKLPVALGNQERIASKSFHLKDEDDFPPLSS
uniref:Uncharacterized protein n=3 Tax=Kalanchoe fedtschenkoi TaxID=63787 RepID=A0A7N0T340_KALFE